MQQVSNFLTLLIYFISRWEIQVQIRVSWWLLTFVQWMNAVARVEPPSWPDAVTRACSLASEEFHPYGINQRLTCRRDDYWWWYRRLVVWKHWNMRCNPTASCLAAVLVLQEEFFFFLHFSNKIYPVNLSFLGWSACVTSRCSRASLGSWRGAEWQSAVNGGTKGKWLLALNDFPSTPCQVSFGANAKGRQPRVDRLCSTPLCTAALLHTKFLSSPAWPHLH